MFQCSKLTKELVVLSCPLCFVLSLECEELANYDVAYKDTHMHRHAVL